MNLVIKGSSAQLKCKHQSTHRHTAKPNKYTYFFPRRKGGFRNAWKMALKTCYIKHLYKQEKNKQKKIKHLFSFFFNTVAILQDILLGTFLNSI